jgi:hypothetical protein
MNKLTRRIATAGVSVALVGGTLLAGGGSASAATSQVDGHTPAQAAAVGDAKAFVDHRGQHSPGSDWHADRGDGRPDLWIAGQLTIVDPWITDQLTLFASSGTPDHG